MGILAMNHFTALCDGVDGVEIDREFYCNMLDLEVGPRPAFPNEGLWLYAGGRPILHIIHRSQLGDVRAGAIDHMAFSASDLSGTVSKLEKAGVKYDLRMLVDGSIWQLFFEDPFGAKVELDFNKSEEAPVGYVVA